MGWGSIYHAILLLKTPPYRLSWVNRRQLSPYEKAF